VFWWSWRWIAIYVGAAYNFTLTLRRMSIAQCNIATPVAVAVRHAAYSRMGIGVKMCRTRVPSFPSITELSTDPASNAACSRPPRNESKP
jgi:hypothetical protein